MVVDPVELLRLGMFDSGKFDFFLISQDLLDDFYVQFDGSVRFWCFD